MRKRNGEKTIPLRTAVANRKNLDSKAMVISRLRRSVRSIYD